MQRIALITLMMIMILPVALVARPHQVNAQSAPGAPVVVVGTSPTDGNFIQNTFTAIATAAEKLKGFTLDPIAWAVAKAVLQSVVNSTIKWVNSGFNGAPAFATNLNSTLGQVGDTAANQFIQQLGTNSSIKSPFQSQVASAVSTNYFQSTGANGFFATNPFTLGASSPNPTAFLAGGTSGFAQGGWNAWLSTAMNSSNNPYGATLLATQALGGQVANAQSVQKTELNWGNGFLSWRGNCQTTTSGGTQAGAPNPGGGTQGTAGTSGTVSLSGNSGCQSQNIITPGSAISNSLYKSLGSGIDTLVTASQFNELVSALLGQLINNVLGGNGLKGISQPSASTGNVPYFSQTTTGTPATSVGASLSSSFSQTLTSQLAEIQTFENNWETIETAAQQAEAAVQSSACFPNGPATIQNTILPVIAQANVEIGNANTSISTLNTIEGEVPPANSTTDTTAQLAQASADYSTFLSANTTPADSDITYAASQSASTGTSTPPSLYSQMEQITQQAQTCAAP